MDQQKEGEDEKVPGWPDEPETDPLADPLALDDPEREKPEAVQHDQDSNSSSSSSSSSSSDGDHMPHMDDQPNTHPQTEVIEQEMITVDDVRFSENSCDSGKEDGEVVKDVSGDVGHTQELQESECADFGECDTGVESVRTPPPNSLHIESSSEDRNESTSAFSRPGSKAESCDRNSEGASPARVDETNMDCDAGNAAPENAALSIGDNSSIGSPKIESRQGNSKEGGTRNDSLDEMDSDKEQQAGGSDGGDEDDDNKIRRLRAKRRHVSGNTDVIAPAPKVKRKCRKNISEDEKDSERDRDSERRKRDESKSSDDEGDDSDSDEDSRRRKLRRRSGAVSGLSAKPKVKNLRRNIRDIISDDKLEDDTLVAQKEEQLRLQRLQEKRVALREYLEQQQSV